MRPGDQDRASFRMLSVSFPLEKLTNTPGIGVRYAVRQRPWSILDRRSCRIHPSSSSHYYSASDYNPSSYHYPAAYHYSSNQPAGHQINSP